MSTARKEIKMGTKRTTVVIHHDEGYGDGLLDHINIALRGRDMFAEAIHDSTKTERDFANAIIRRLVAEFDSVIELMKTEMDIENEPAWEARRDAIANAISLVRALDVASTAQGEASE